MWIPFGVCTGLAVLMSAALAATSNLLTADIMEEKSEGVDMREVIRDVLTNCGVVSALFLSMAVAA